MKLRLPVDMLILQVLSDGEHANPIRVRFLVSEQHGDEIRNRLGKEMWSLDYITQRMSTLRRDLELLERVPPDDSGLYRISDLGHYALRHTIEEGDDEISIRELLEKSEEVGETEPVPADAIPWDLLANYS